MIALFERWVFQHSPEWWVAVFSLLGLGWYYGVLPIFKFVHRAVLLAPILSSADKALGGLNEAVRRIEAEIAEVKSEVKTNHGGSLKDAVKRIEENVKSVSDKTDAQTKDLTAQIRGVKATSLQAQRAASRAEKIATQSLEIVAGR